MASDDPSSSVESDFTAFAATRWQRLVRAAYLLTGDHQDSEDLVQITLAKAYARWEHVRSREHPDAYVRRALVNTHLSLLRKRRVAHVLMPWVPDRGSGDEQGRLEHHLALLQALETLPPRQRVTIVLRYLEDMSERETAAAMNCSVGSVKSQAAKGLAKLRSHPALADAGFAVNLNNRSADGGTR